MLCKKISWLLVVQVLMVSVKAQTLWCPKSGIEGFEAEAHKAKTVLAGNTSSFETMEVYATVKDGRLYIQSNYIPPGGEYPLKLTSDEAYFDMKDWVKYLIDPENATTYDAAFDAAYSHITIYADADILKDARYKNMDWGDVRSVKIVDGSTVLNTELIPSAGKRAVKIRENMYVALETDEVCETADRLSKIEEVINKLSKINDEPADQQTISVSGSDGIAKLAGNAASVGDFLNSVASSGLTLINLACDPPGTLKDILFAVYKENSRADNNAPVARVTIKFPEVPETVVAAASPDQPYTTAGSNDIEDRGEKSGHSAGWYIGFGVAALLIIRGIVKSSS